MAIVGTLGIQLPTVLPLLARFTSTAEPSVYAALVCGDGLGAIVGVCGGTARPRLVTRCSSSAPRSASGAFSCWQRRSEPGIEILALALARRATV